MNILITGSTGLVGSDILKILLLDEKLSIVALSRNKQSFAHSKLTWIYSDFSNSKFDFKELLRGIDVVVHIAADIGKYNLDHNFINSINININFTSELFLNCKSSSVKKIIYISTYNFLRKPLDKVITERHEIAPLSSYAIGKYWGEMLLFSYLAEKNIEVVSLRITSPISCNFNHLHNSIVKIWISRALKRKAIVVFGKGNRIQDYIATDDIARAIILSIQNNVSGIYNLASAAPISNLKLAEIIASWGGVEIEFSGVDALEHVRWNISLDKAKEDLNFMPEYTSRQAIERLINSNITTDKTLY